MSTSNDAAILALAGRAAGVCTRAELIAAGLAKATIADRVRAGFLVRVGSGVYEVPALTTDLTPAFLAARAHPTGAVSHRTAARLWDFPLQPAEPDEPLEVTVPRPGGTRPRLSGVRLHVTRQWAPVDRHEPIPGLLATSRARTIVDLAGTDIGDRRLRHVVQTQIVQSPLTLDDIATCLDRAGGRGVAGSGRLWRLLHGLGGDEPAPQSELERRLALLLDRRFRRQYRPPWYEGNRGVVDFAEPESKVIVEADGRRWHTVGQAMADDRRRDRAAAANGWLVLRVTWSDVIDRPEATATEICSVIDRRSRRAA